MKKLILISAVCILCGLTAHAQVPNRLADKYKQHFSEILKQKGHQDIPKKGLFRTGTEAVLEDSLLSYDWDEFTQSWPGYPESKRHYEFNSQGWLTAERSFIRKANGNGMANEHEYLWNYNADGNQSSMLQNRFDTLAGKWIPVARDSIVYGTHLALTYTNYHYNPLENTWFIAFYQRRDENDLFTEAYFLDWDSTYTIDFGFRYTNTWSPARDSAESEYQYYDPASAGWINMEKFQVTFRNDTLPLSAVFYQWNSESLAWDLKNRELYSYEDELLTAVVFQNRKGSEFRDTTRIVYEYGSNRLWSIELNQFWNDSAWVNDNQTIQEYNAVNKISRILTQNWQEGSWKNNDQTLQTYSTVNKSTSMLYQRYEDDIWKDYSLFEETFDGNDSITESVYKSWDLGDGIVSGSSYRYLYTYEPNARKTEVRQNWNTENAGWVNSRKSDWYYSLHSISLVPELTADEVKIYPNPATDVLFFDGLPAEGKISISDLSGRRMLCRPINGNRFDISALNTGIYLLRIETAKGIINKKIMKR